MVMKKNGQKSLKRTGYSSAKPPVDDESGDAGPLKAFGVPCPVISETGVRIVHFLIGKPPQTITAMMKALNVARAAITHELNNLVDIGYVDRALEKNTGRGRPRYLFSVTKKAMRDLFESSQDILCPAFRIRLGRKRWNRSGGRWPIGWPNFTNGSSRARHLKGGCAKCWTSSGGRGDWPR